LNLAAEQEKTVMEKWLPELKSAVLNAQKSLEDCKYVGGLVSTLPSLEVKSSVVYTAYTFIYTLNRKASQLFFHVCINFTIFS
jgi:hypothetical protein